ncbi:MAG: hypothetical protein ACRD0W_00245 [Acidimicrobiales bacterium]
MPDPLWINASGGAPSYDATELRQALALALTHGGGQNLGARSGVRPGGTQLQTSIAGSTITVQEGVACLYEPTPSAARAPYWVALPADETHALTAAHATNPRKDITVLRVYDHDQDSSGLRLARSEYLVGTAAPSPTEPAVPAGAFKLSLIDVPAQGGGSPAVTINHPFTVAAGGIVPVRNSTEEAALSLYDGQVWHRLDTGDLRARIGGVSRTVPVFAADGDLAVPGDLIVAGIGQTLFIRKTVDESVASSTVLQDDNHITFAVAANTSYILDALLVMRAPIAADIKMAWICPASAILDCFAFSQFDGTNRHMIENATHGFPAEPTAHPITVHGHLRIAGTAGTFKLQWAQNTSDAGNTTINEDSYAELRRVG